MLGFGVLLGTVQCLITNLIVKAFIQTLTANVRTNGNETQTVATEALRLCKGIWSPDGIAVSCLCKLVWVQFCS